MTEPAPIHPLLIDDRDVVRRGLALCLQTFDVLRLRRRSNMSKLKSTKHGNTILARLDVHAHRAKVALSLGAVGAYVSAFLPLYRLGGAGVAALAALPVAVVGWIFGMRAGLLAGLLSLPLNTLLLALVKQPDLGILYRGPGLAGFAVTVLVGAAVGQQRDLGERLRRELSRRERVEAADHENKQRYRALFERANDAVFLLSLDGVYLTANQQAADMLGYSVDELVGMSFEQVVEPGEHKDSRNILAALLAGETIPIYERTFRRKDGSEIPVEINVALVSDCDGSPMHIQSVVRDITARKRAEAELEARARQQEAVAKLGQRALVYTDLPRLMDEAVALVAQTLEVEFCKVLERLPDGDALLLRAGVGWKEGLIGHATVGAGSDSQAGYTLLSGEPVILEDLRTETRFSGPSLLREHGVISGVSVIIPNSGEPFGVLGAHTAQHRTFFQDDIHFLQAIAHVLADAIARGQTETALRESEERYRALFENAPVGLGVAKADGSLLAFNNAMLEPGGYTREDVARIGNVAHLYSDPGERARVLAQVERQGFLHQHEVRFKRKGGGDYNVLLSMRPITIEGQPCWQAAVEDITERKQADKERERLLAAEREQRLLAESLAEVTLALTSQVNLPAVLDEILRQVQRLVPYKTVNITLLESDTLRTVRWQGYKAYDAEEFISNLTQPLDTFPIDAEAVQTRKPVIISDTDQDPRWVPLDEAAWIRSNLTMPICLHDRVLGLLRLDSDAPGGFSVADAERLQPLTNAAAVALENARLFEQAQAEIAERIQAEKQIQRQLQRLASLHSIDMAITASLDLRVTLNVLLGEVTTQLHVDAADILLLRPRAETLEYAAGRGFRTDAITRARPRLGQGYAGRAALDRRIISVPNLPELGSAFMRSLLLTSEKFVTYYGVPLIAKGKVVGVLEIFHRAPLDPDPKWLDFLEILAAQAAIAIDNAALFDNLQRSNIELTLAYDATLEGWARALDLRDEETEGHTRRVTELTLRLARAMGMGETELEHVRRGALLHDIGKMGIPDRILHKPGPLTEAEWETMRRHPVYAYEMLTPIAYLRPALDIPYCHHEKWVGTGYPQGLRGEQIPLAARIFAVVDVWDALRSDRPYRQAWPEEKVLLYIREQTGTHFDPQVVEAFLEIVER